MRRAAAPAPPAPPTSSRYSNYPFDWRADPRAYVRPRGVLSLDPARDSSYFISVPDALRARPVIGVVVPCYSEEASALERTLAALALQQYQLARFFSARETPELTPTLVALVIADGHDRVSESMQRLLFNTFGYSPEHFDLAEFEEVRHLIYEPRRKCVPTSATSATSASTSASTSTSAAAAAARELAAVPISVEEHALFGEANRVQDDEYLEQTAHFVLPLFVSLLVKRTNGKKHHSHKWFFQAFCDDIRATAAFATDVGTIYSPEMLLKLWLRLSSDPRISGVCGHQAVMSHADQHDPLDTAPEPVLEWALRSVQSFDFESGQSIFNGSHSLSGFLAVLPGPCGLYRMDAIRGEALDRYFAIVEAKDDSFVVANLKIAEDRILSAAAVLWASRPDPSADPASSTRRRDCITEYVPDATFFFEAEVTLGELVRQRRRWLNGTLAGYLWLFQQLWRRLCVCCACCRAPCRDAGSLPGDPDRDDHSFAFIVIALLNVVSQMFIFAAIFLLPGFFFASTILSVQGIHVAQSVISGVADPFPATRAMWAVAWVLGVAYFSHLYYAQQQRAFWSWPWISVTIVNALSILLVLAASLSLFVLSFDDEFMARFEATSGSTDVIGVRVAAIAGASYFLVSFLLSALRSFSAMSQMSSSVLPYILFLPTINAYFFAYSLCRLDDLSWGTKEQRARPVVAPVALLPTPDTTPLQLALTPLPRPPAPALATRALFPRSAVVPVSAAAPPAVAGVAGATNTAIIINDGEDVTKRRPGLSRAVSKRIRLEYVRRARFRYLRNRVMFAAVVCNVGFAVGLLFAEFENFIFVSSLALSATVLWPLLRSLFFVARYRCQRVGADCRAWWFFDIEDADDLADDDAVAAARGLATSTLYAPAARRPVAANRRLGSDILLFYEVRHENSPRASLAGLRGLDASAGAGGVPSDAAAADAVDSEPEDDEGNGFDGVSGRRSGGPMPGAGRVRGLRGAGDRSRIVGQRGFPGAPVV